MLHSVKFLCSVVAAFARLAHVLLTKALMSLCCSPTSSSSAVLLPAGFPPARATKKVHPVAVTVTVDGENKQLLAAPPTPVLVLPLFKGGNSKAEERMKVARGRPLRLVIPPPVAVTAARAGGGDPFGEGDGWEAQVATEVEEKGEGFCVASRRGVRHAMEDGFGVVTDHNVGGGSQLAFYGVYDGHGGRAAVDFVADRLGKNVAASVAAASTTSQHRRPGSPPTSTQEGLEDDDVTAAIRAAYLTTDSEFLSKGVRGGACAVTALVKDGELYVSNVGDCRAVLGSRGGVATALTTDQTPGRDDERLRIESSGGYVSRGGSGVWRVQDSLAVSRAFGDAAVKPWVTCEPETMRVRLTADCRFLVLASDGLWGKVSNQEAVDVVVAARSTSGVVDSVDSCKELVAMARSRGSRDDITVMVVDLQRFVREKI